MSISSIPDPPVPESGPTIADIASQVLRRLNDPEQAIWTNDEVRRYLTSAYLQMALRTRCFWDQYYADNQPRGFSATQPWEVEYETFSYGVANFTCEEERRYLDEPRRIGPGNHTSPTDAPFVADAGGAAGPPATLEMPKTLLEVERATWNDQVIEAAMPADARRWDSRYEMTTGPVIAYLWRQDGPRTFRHVRIPSASAPMQEVSGSWGLVRDVSAVSAGTVSGTWGIARRVPGYHGLHGTVWGAPRRFYTEELRTRIDHWREGMLFGQGQTYELPVRYAAYLRNYALSECLRREGPGQDLKLSAWYGELWERGIKRMITRRMRMSHATTHVLGGGGKPIGRRPPRPRLPWNYPQRTR
jgi:hypothetical protein